MTDEDLVARSKSGEFAAFEELVNRHERRLFAIALRIVRQRADAEDAVQTAFLNALSHLAEFREESSFATWITHIVVNTALKTLRKRGGPVDEDEAGLIRHPEFIADWRGEPAALLEREELKKMLDEAVDALPEGQRLVFTLRDVAGLSVEDAAKALGISEANVKVRLLRARLALRERLTRAFGDETRRVRRPHEDAGATPAEEIRKSYEERP